MDKLSTSQVAKRLGVLRPSLQRGIDEGRIPAPPLRKIGGIEMRLWDEADIARARNAMESGKWQLNRKRPTKKRAKRKP